MPTTLSNSKLLPTEEPSSIDGNNRGHHERTWRHEASATDVGGAIIIIAQALSGANACPEIGDTFNYGSLDDEGSYCQNIRCWRPEPKEHPLLWNITATFDPPQENKPSDNIGEPNPLDWVTVYDIDYLEEQVPLEKARIVEDLTFIGRAANSEGPIVNSAGIEFTEAALTTVYYPILTARKNYATLDEIVALNAAFQKTVNDDTWFGASARKAKYLTTESGGQQQIGGVTFYPGTTKVMIKDLTWDRKILNNGWTHLEIDAETDSGYKEDADGNIKRFDNLVEDNPDSAPDADPTAKCSEPLNLASNGLLLFPGASAIYLTYRELAEVDFDGIGIGG